MNSHHSELVIQQTFPGHDEKLDIVICQLTSGLFSVGVWCQSVMSSIVAIAWWRHSGGNWHNALFLTVASRVNFWADAGGDFQSTETLLYQAWDMKINTR